jgi:hypothetical protein
MRITEKENMMKTEPRKINEDFGMGPISSEGEKTIKVTHKTSGKTLVVVDTSASRKECARMGYTEAEEEIRVLDIDWGTAEIGGK